MTELEMLAEGIKRNIVAYDSEGKGLTVRLISLMKTIARRNGFYKLTRLIVPEHVYEIFTEELGQTTETVGVGIPHLSAPSNFVVYGIEISVMKNSEAVMEEWEKGGCSLPENKSDVVIGECAKGILLGAC